MLFRSAQLAIQREHIAVHRAQITALHRQLKTENQLSLILQRCHIKDTQRRDDLEDWRVLAQEKLQHEEFLTPRGKLRIMQTLPDLTSRTGGYLAVMFLESALRKLWCKIELEKEGHAHLNDYFIEDGYTALCKDQTDERCQDVIDESTLVELKNDGDNATATIGSFESSTSDVEVSYVKDLLTSKCPSESASHEGHQRDSDAHEKGEQAVNEEVGNSPQVLAEKAFDHEVSKNADQDYQDEDVAIDPYISINHDQSGDALQDRGRKAEGSQDDEGLNEAFREIESEFVIDLDPDTTSEDPSLRNT